MLFLSHIKRFFRVFWYQPHIPQFWNARYAVLATKYLYPPFRYTPLFGCFGARHIFHDLPVLSSYIISIIIIGQTNNSKCLTMNYLSYCYELCRHIQEKRGTVQCNWVNNYSKKTSRKIWLQGFWRSDKSSADREKREPQESKRRNVYFSSLPCEYWEQRATPKSANLFWAYAPLWYIRRPVSFREAGHKKHATSAARYIAWYYER